MRIEENGPVVELNTRSFVRPPLFAAENSVDKDLQKPGACKGVASDPSAVATDSWEPRSTNGGEQGSISIIAAAWVASNGKVSSKSLAGCCFFMSSCLKQMFHQTRPQIPKCKTKALIYNPLIDPTKKLSDANALELTNSFLHILDSHGLI